MSQHEPKRTYICEHVAQLYFNYFSHSWRFGTLKDIVWTSCFHTTEKEERNILHKKKKLKIRNSCSDIPDRSVQTEHPVPEVRWSFFQSQHFPVSVFHDCQMRSLFLALLSTSPSAAVAAYRDESTARRGGDRRWISFAVPRREIHGADRAEAAEHRLEIRNLGCFQACARSWAFLQIRIGNSDDINARKWFTGGWDGPAGEI